MLLKRVCSRLSGGFGNDSGVREVCRSAGECTPANDLSPPLQLLHCDAKMSCGDDRVTSSSSCDNDETRGEESGDEALPSAFGCALRVCIAQHTDTHRYASEERDSENSTILLSNLEELVLLQLELARLVPQLLLQCCTRFNTLVALHFGERDELEEALVECTHHRRQLRLATAYIQG
jgi:hypothetical protein